MKSDDAVGVCAVWAAYLSVQGQVCSPLLSTGDSGGADWEKKLCDKAAKDAQPLQQQQEGRALCQDLLWKAQAGPNSQEVLFSLD